MDAKPQRASRVLRSRQDENKPALLQQKSTNSVVNKASDNHKAGLKGAARRAVFTDVSNKSKASISAPNKENCKPEVIIIQEKKATAAITKPAQRTSGLKNTSSDSAVITVAPAQQKTSQQNRPRRPASRKTTVYEDKRPSPKRTSPKRSSPKVSRDGILKKESALCQNPARRNPRSLPSIARVKDTEKEDEPVYSDQQPHLFDEYVDEDENTAELEEYEDASEGEDGVRLADKTYTTDVGALSDYETEGEDETDYTTARSRGGDNTTGVTTQVLVPKWTTKARKQMDKLREEFVSYDEEDEGDISMVAEYGDEIFEYMRELENKLLPNPHYMDFQSEIKWSMRAILMDWLVQVHQRFNLLPETMFLCTNYIDRFLSSKVVSLGKLQLVGATALFVAAKYEEINCPSVHEIVYMVDGGYTADEILKAERFMLSQLQFELGWPGPMSFLRRISKADDYDLETRTLAKYFLEITVMDERFVSSPPSFLAAGAHCLARHMLGKGEWTSAHTYYSGYTASQLEPLVQTLVECCENPSVHHSAVYEKFTDRRYKRASLFVANWMSSSEEE